MTSEVSLKFDIPYMEGKVVVHLRRNIIIELQLLSAIHLCQNSKFIFSHTVFSDGPADCLVHVSNE